MLIRVLVLTYFPAFFVGVGLSKVVGSDILRGLPLAVAIGLLMIAGARSAVDPRARAIGPVRPILAVAAYSMFYGVLFFPRAFPGLPSLGLVPSLTLHVLFWHAAYWSPIYVRSRDRFFADLSSGLLLGFIVGFVGALQGAGWSLRPGALHNLSEQGLFVRSDLDVPLLAVALGVIAVGAIAHGQKAMSVGLVERLVGGHRRTAGALLVFLPLFALFLYSRRVPIAALLVSVAVVLVGSRHAGSLLYLMLVAPLAPLVWERLVPFLLALTQNPVVDAILARNDIDSYVTASNRATTWLATIDFLSVVRPQHWYGYGGAPEHLLPLGIGWEHVHNGPLQLILDAGLPVLFLAVILVLRTGLLLGRLVQDRVFGGPAVAMLALLTVWLVESAVEPGLRGFSVIHMLFLLVVTISADMYHEARRAYG